MVLAPSHTLLSHRDVWRLDDLSVLAVPETGPCEDGAYFITKCSTVSVKWTELHWAVIGNGLLQCLKPSGILLFSFFRRVSPLFFFLFFISSWGLVKLLMKGRLQAASTEASQK